MATKKSDTPPPISFNLDKLEREVAIEPFTVVIGGKPITFAGLDEIDWQELMDLMSNPARLFSVAIADPKEREHVFGTKIPGWKVRALVDEYMKHYGMEMSPGESDASS